MLPETSLPKGPLFHMEPAHPGVIKLRDDLVIIYKLIRERFQATLDRQFDQVSRQIGFVVATTIPVNFEVAGKEVKVSFAAENMAGTLFEQTFMPTLNELGQAMAGNIGDGSYMLYVFWYDALKLKLHTDWMEPAHIFDRDLGALVRPGVEISSAALRPGTREPAHWFRADVRLEVQEALVISAIDEVYSDLRLVDRIENARQAATITRSAVALRPGFREPAHFRQLLEGFDRETLDKVIQVLTAIQQMR